MTNNRLAALKILARGHATMAEIAALAGVSRQGVRKWAQQAGIDPVETRRRRLQALWAAATRRSERHTGVYPHDNLGSKRR
jgi:predicted aminopeptidase